MERLQRRVRDYRAGYKQSMAVLVEAKRLQPSLFTKTSLLLGLGEEEAEVRQALRDLRDSGVDIITLGQYLRPTRRHMSVQRFVPPEEFEAWREEAAGMGFAYAAAGPLVRSSYKAGELFVTGLIEGKEKEKGKDKGKIESKQAAL